MQAFLGWVGSLFQSLLGLLTPLFSEENLTGMARALWLALHIALIAGIAIGLWFLDVYVTKWWTIIPGTSLWLRQAWLPILFLLFYAMLLLAWVLYRLLVQEEMPGDFPDIDQAWGMAVDALRQAGLKPDDLPLYLILGQPEGGPEALIRASGLNIKLQQVPSGDPPVCLFGAEDGLFVMCPGASVLGSLARELTSPITRGPAVEEGGSSNERTLKPGEGGDGQSLEIQAIFARAPGGDPRRLPAPERRELRRMERLASTMRPASRQAEQLEVQTARLRHFCRLLVRDRKPYSAVNGILVLVPFAGLDSPQDAADVGDACKRDMEAARSALGVHCPVFVTICDMESAPGFSDFIAGHPVEERRRRIGQRTALVPQLKGGPEAVAAMFRSLAEWICQGFLRTSIVGKFRLEGSPTPTLEEALQGNARLFELLCDMQVKRANLARILEEGFSTYAPPERLLFGGCYLAATGPSDPPNQQAFLAGVFGRLQEKVDAIYWTDEVKEREARLSALIATGWVVLAALGAGAAALIAWAYFTRKP
jgi:hypothetical protein